MKKNILTTTLLAILVSGVSMVNANTMSQSDMMAKQVATTYPALMPTVVQEADKKEEVSFSEKLERAFVDNATLLEEINRRIQATDVEATLEQANKAKAYVQKQKALTEAMREEQAQKKIIAQMNADILKEITQVKSVEEVKEVEKRVEEEKVIQQQQEMAPVIVDNVMVYSVYGSPNNLFAEMTVNGTKYQVQKGHKSEGFTVVSVDKYGVMLAKNGVEQYVNVSAQQPTVISTQAQYGAELVNPPNVIKPYELK